MSPESHKSNLDILSESERIKVALLGVQLQIDEQSTVLREQLLSGVRNQLGYPEPSYVDLSDLVDTRISAKTPVVSPESVEAVLPLTPDAAKTTLDARTDLGKIIRGDDDRLVVVIGPCSIHDPKSALEYAKFVNEMREQYGDDLLVMMRFYAEKPRTELGWKGFVADPRLDGSDDMDLGLIAGRMIAGRIVDMGVPLGRECLNAQTPQYGDGLFAYDIIGARNIEDQKSREYGSATSAVIGGKNATDGSLDSVVSALVSMNGAHTLLGLSSNGQQAILGTKGNDTAHIILRGGKHWTSFGPSSVEDAVTAVRTKNRKTGLKIPEAVVIDTSHKNKVKGSQAEALASISEQVAAGQFAIKGILHEGHINSGRQDLDSAHPEKLEYGVSITDACDSIEQTQAHLAKLAIAVQARRHGKLRRFNKN